MIFKKRGFFKGFYFIGNYLIDLKQEIFYL